MKEKLEQIRREALAALSETKTAQDLDALRVKYLGKKGALTAVLKQMGGLSAEERPIIGQLANEVREALTTALEQEQKRIEKAAAPPMATALTAKQMLNSKAENP